MSPEREPFRCTGGFNFVVADANGDVYRCTNFAAPPKQQPMGHVYRAIRFDEAPYPCTEAFCICPQHKFDPRLHAAGMRPQARGWRRLPYSAWLHWSVTDECFLSCTYCEAGQRRFDKRAVRPIDTERLLATLEETGRIWRVSFTGGGEPFAVPNMTEACAAITRRHFVSFNTNLLHSDMKDFLRQVDPRKIIQIQASAHLTELERTNNLERFAANCRACRRAGLEINPVAVGIPSIIPEVKRFRRELARLGVHFTFAPYSGAFQGRRYPEAYTAEELAALGMDRLTAGTHLVGAAASWAERAVSRTVRRLRSRWW